MYEHKTNQYDTYVDEELVRISKYDNYTFEYLIKKYKKLVSSCARNYYMVGAEQEDLIQEGMIALVKAVRDFNPNICSFKTFATICIKRGIITAVRASTRYKHILLNQSVSFDESTNDFNDDFCSINLTLDNHADNPLNMYVKKEDCLYLKNAIKTLLSDCEEKVLVLFLEGYSYVKISESLGITEKSVDTALTRARRKLRKFKNAV